jgi:hypothetical protein
METLERDYRMVSATFLFAAYVPHTQHSPKKGARHRSNDRSAGRVDRDGDHGHVSVCKRRLLHHSHDYSRRFDSEHVVVDGCTLCRLRVDDVMLTDASSRQSDVRC